MERRGTPSQCLGRRMNLVFAFWRFRCSFSKALTDCPDEEFQWSLVLAPRSVQSDLVNGAENCFSRLRGFSLATPAPNSIGEEEESPSTSSVQWARLFGRYTQSPNPSKSAILPNSIRPSFAWPRHAQLALELLASSSRSAQLNRGHAFASPSDPKYGCLDTRATI